MDTDTDRQDFTQAGQDGDMSPESFWEENAATPTAPNPLRPLHVPTPHSVQFMSQEWLAAFARLQQGHAELLARQTVSQNLQVETFHRQLDLHASLNSIITGSKAQYMGPEFQLNNQPALTQPFISHSEIKRETGQQVHHQPARAFSGYEQYNSNGDISQNANGMESTTFVHGNTMLSSNFDHLISYNNLSPMPTPGHGANSNGQLSVPQSQTTSQHMDQDTGDILYQHPPGFSSPPSLVEAYPRPAEHSPASVGKRQKICDSPIHRYVSNMRSDSYLRDINQLSSMLPRAHLEKVLADLAVAEQGAVESGPPVSNDLVKAMLLKQIHQQHSTVVSKFAMAIPSLALHTEADRPLGHIGLFQTLPVECMVNIISFLPFKSVLTITHSVCRTFYLVAGHSQLWARIPIETQPHEHGLSPQGFLHFLRWLPESCMRMFTFDAAFFDHTVSQEVLDILTRTKQFNIQSLHIVGKKATLVTAQSVVRRLWAEKITTLSVTDVIQSKVDPDTLIKMSVPFLLNLQRLRIEGVVRREALLELSALRRQFKTETGGPVLGDNCLTHFSFAGKNGILAWDDIKNFGKWFPELESLFVSCITGGDPWEEKYALPPSSESSLKYRHPTSSDISWVPITRLKFFGVEHIGEPVQKRKTKAQENIHSAYLWALIHGSDSTLERLEISRGEESTSYAPRKSHKNRSPQAGLPDFMIRTRPAGEHVLPNLKYLYLAYWSIPWRAFVGVVPTTANHTPGTASIPPPEPQEPYFQFRNLREIVLFKCCGLPQYSEVQEGAGLRWLSELRQVWGPDIRGLDETLCGSEGVRLAAKNNIGQGSW